LCFDIGGVLIRITPLWSEAARVAGIELPSRFEAHTELDSAPFFPAYQRGEISHEDFYEQLRDFLGLATTLEAERVHRHILVEPYPEVEAMIRDFNDAGYSTACLSNTNEPHWREMSESGRFPAHLALGHRFASHEMGLLKPQPEIFQAFEKAMGVTGNEVAFFDDSTMNVEAAKALGWHAFRIDPARNTVPQVKTYLESVVGKSERL